ncbi:MAG TPA: molecular chaperone HtpG, partial [Rhabdochlamydiaceae bacterium]|nr:molecular chaperone HtpG [Rhabdochlamydiaceae bacterium]
MQGTLKINTDNILPIIKKWLYSDKEIFVRELVSNSCDALNKLSILREQNAVSFQEEELRIDLVIDKKKGTLTFIDTGLGMTAEEVEKYIAQVAFSGAEEFLEKYKSKDEKDQIIGHFGLGFYSAYMVAKKVEINTLSYKEGAESALWSCDGSSSYVLEKGTRSSRGTEITLFINEEDQDYLEESKIRDILSRYCAFLPFPIYLNNTRINTQQPLWLKPASECTEQEYLEFYRHLYPTEPNPVFWIHLNVDYPFRLKGILYFPKIHRKLEFGKSSIQLYCNRVFVSDHCKDLIPEYLMVLRGMIDSPDIPLNVSRSFLQMDRTVRQLGTHISKKVADRLSSLYQADQEKFVTAWQDIELVIKLGSIQDEKFYERSKEFLIWKNLKEEWTTLDQYLERGKAHYPDKVFYTTDGQKSSPFLDLYKNKGIEVLFANSHIDTGLMSFLESKYPRVKFQRIDGAIDTSILDETREKSLLDASGKTEAVHIADYIRSTLSLDKVEVEAKSLASDHLPGFVMMDEKMRRMRDYFALSSEAPLPAQKKTFVVNTNSKLIRALYGLKDKDPVLAKNIVEQVYELSLLSQKELEPAQMSQFIQRSNEILEAVLKVD